MEGSGNTEQMSMLQAFLLFPNLIFHMSVWLHGKQNTFKFILALLKHLKQTLRSQNVQGRNYANLLDYVDLLIRS